jgi:Putative peptidoglycan binding domain
MNYLDLRRGNKTPAVAVLQKLLNRGGAKVDVDGDFGAQTEKAVISFQRSHHMYPDGIVAKETWPRLAANADLHIVDCVDVFDKDLYDLEAADIAKAGGHPLLIGGECNGVEDAVTMILSSVRSGNVFLLRFHGHGAPGLAGISIGQDPAGFGERSDIDTANFETIRPALQRLRSIFGPYGNVQFMHCETGSGPKGRALLQSIADTLQVPATAGLHLQYGGGTYTFRFEGPTHTAFPSGNSLRTWSQTRPDFAGMNVA